MSAGEVERVNLQLELPRPFLELCEQCHEFPKPTIARKCGPGPIIAAPLLRRAGSRESLDRALPNGTPAIRMTVIPAHGFSADVVAQNTRPSTRVERDAYPPGPAIVARGRIFRQ